MRPSLLVLQLIHVRLAALKLPFLSRRSLFMTAFFLPTSSDAAVVNRKNDVVAVMTRLESDEFSVLFQPPHTPLGFSLEDVTFGSAGRRVQVGSILPMSRLWGNSNFISNVADGNPEPRILDKVNINLLVRSINFDTSVQQLSAFKLLTLLKDLLSVDAPFSIEFKSATAFGSALSELTESAAVSTKISSRDDSVTVTQLRQPSPNAINQAAKGDLVEISYQASFVDPETLFTVPYDVSGRGGDTTIQFALQSQPAGQFPPGLDVGLEGMRCGEIRKVVVPPQLGYGSKGFKTKSFAIPPNAQIIYIIELKLINAVAF